MKPHQTNFPNHPVNQTLLSTFMSGALITPDFFHNARSSMVSIRCDFIRRNMWLNTQWMPLLPYRFVML